MKSRYFDKQMQKYGLCFLAYSLISIIVVLVTKNFVQINMTWNVFLAMLPLIFAKMLQKKSEEPGKVGKVVLGFLWLFFFPNAPYTVTDFIHISGVKFVSENKYTHAIYSTNIISWVKITHIGLGMLIGTLSGLLSLYIIHQLFLKNNGKMVANSMLLIACLLSGYAIYIGRFLRFNSWDVLRSILLYSKLVSNISRFSFMFSLLFALYVLASYCIFYMFYHEK